MAHLVNRKWLERLKLPTLWLEVLMRQRFARIPCVLSSLVGSTISASTKDHLTSKNYGAFECLRDCIIINILSRLPIDCILKCQRVCRLWKALISSRYFATLLHEKERFFIQYDELDFFVLEENDSKEKVFKKVSLKPKLTMKYHPRLLHSYQGLLLFGDHVFPYTFFVFNPITQEEITIKHTVGAGSICGFYLCPLTRELKILYAKVRSRGCQYLIYTIWSQTWRRIRSPALNSIPTHLSPAIVNGAMHWIMDREFGEEDGIPPCSIAILMFRLDTEELSHMPHPGTQCSSRQSHECQTHETMSLLVKEEHLSFCQLRIHEKAMDIWILEDYEIWAWIRSYRVNLDLDVNVFPYHSPSAYCESELIHWGMAQFVKPSSIHDGELLICLTPTAYKEEALH